MTEQAQLSKAQQSDLIFQQEVEKGDDKLRARVIARFMAELGMSKAGSSTYFQNCKTRAAGNKVKHYYKPKTEKNANDVDQAAKDEALANAETFDVVLLDGTTKCFMSQQARDEFIENNSDMLLQ